MVKPDLRLLPVILYAATTVVVLVLVSGGMWWLLAGAIASGDFARHPIPSIIALICAIPILAPALVIAWLLGLVCYRAAERALKSKGPAETGPS